MPKSATGSRFVKKFFSPSHKSHAYRKKGHRGAGFQAGTEGADRD